MLGVRLPFPLRFLGYLGVKIRFLPLFRVFRVFRGFPAPLDVRRSAVFSGGCSILCAKFGLDPMSASREPITKLDIPGYSA